VVERIALALHAGRQKLKLDEGDKFRKLLNLMISMACGGDGGIRTLDTPLKRITV